MAAGRRLAIGAAIVTGATAYMAYLGGSSSWQYYLSVDECLALPPHQVPERVRISGEVSRDSLMIPTDRQGAEFRLAGTRDTLLVSFAGRVPDNLAEARQVVVEGRLQGPHHLQADSVLTRCASKYTSVEPSTGGRDDAAPSGPETTE